jgi:hypothetical protein
MKKLLATFAVCAVAAGALADGVAFGRGAITVGNEDGAFAFSALDMGPNVGGSVAFALGSFGSRTLSSAAFTRVESAAVGAGQAMFGGMGMYYSATTGRIPVMIECMVTDGGTTGPDTFSIRAVDASNVVVLEVSGELVLGDIAVNGN